MKITLVTLITLVRNLCVDWKLSHETSDSLYVLEHFSWI